jgi:hypothetical protein
MPSTRTKSDCLGCCATEKIEVLGGLCGRVGDAQDAAEWEQLAPCSNSSSAIATEDPQRLFHSEVTKTCNTMNDYKQLDNSQSVRS